MNRSLQIWNFSMVLVVACLGVAKSARCQVTALHGPIGRQDRTLDPTSPSQLVNELPGQLEASPRTVPAQPVASRVDPRDTRPPAQQPRVTAIALESVHDPLYDRIVYELPRPLQAEDTPADAVRFLADPRAVAMLSHGIPREVVIRRIGLLSRLQEAAGRHRFSDRPIIVPVATKSSPASPRIRGAVDVTTVCPHLDQDRIRRLAEQVPPEPPAPAVVAAVMTIASLADSRPADPGTSDLASTAGQQTEPTPSPARRALEYPPEPIATQREVFTAVAKTRDVAIVDRLVERSISGESAPIGTGVGVVRRPRSRAECPPEPPTLRTAPGQRKRTAETTAPTSQVPIQSAVIRLAEETPAAPGLAEVSPAAEEPVLDRPGAVNRIGGVTSRAAVLANGDPLLSPFARQPTRSSIAPAIARALSRAWDLTLAETSRSYAQPARKALIRTLRQWPVQELLPPAEIP